MRERHANRNPINTPFLHCRPDRSQATTAHVKSSQDGNAILPNTVGHDVRRAADDQLACPFDAPWTPASAPGQILLKTRVALSWHICRGGQTIPWAAIVDPGSTAQR